MLKRIVAISTLVCLFIAIPLAIMGIKRVDLGQPFLALMKAVNSDLQNYRIEIPNIPLIPLGSQSGGGWEVLKVVVNFFNFFIQIINIFIQVFNVIIQLFQCIFLVVRHLITFKDTLANYQVPVV